MKRQLTAFSAAATVLLLAGASLSTASDRRAPGPVDFTPEPALTGSMTLDAGGYSLSTGEQLTQSTAYFVAHVEQADGRVHPAFGADPRGVYVFKTTGGRLVVRLMEIRRGELDQPRVN